MKMDENEFNRANFFSSDAEFAASKLLKPRPRRSLSPALRAEMKALRAIVRGFNAIETMGDEHHIVAALNYINNRYGKWVDPRRLTR